MNDSANREGSHILDVAHSWKRERPDLELSDFLLAIYLMRLGRVLDDGYDRMCRERFSISGADVRVLFALRRAGKPYARRPTDLFKALLVTSGAMTKQVDRLSKFGFVERLDDPGYSGGFLIRLTAKGLKVANSATEMLTKHSPIAPGVAALTNAERVAGQKFVEGLLLRLEKDSSQRSAKEKKARTRRASRSKS